VGKRYILLIVIKEKEWENEEQPCKQSDTSSSEHSNLIVAVLGDVTYPRQRLISTLLDDLQVSDLDTRDCEIGDFKLDADWRLEGRSNVVYHHVSDK